MNIRGLIIWHYYCDGKLTNSSSTSFEGTIGELQERIAENFREMNKKKKEEAIVVCHNFVNFHSP
jgi:hypothetical protein